MQRFITFLLMAALILSLAACGETNGTTAPIVSSSTAPQASEATASVDELVSEADNDTQATGQIDPANHVSTLFDVKVGDDGENESIPRVHILFSGIQPEVASEDVTDIVVTKDGTSIEVNVANVLCENSPEETTYRLIFNPPFSTRGNGTGTYSFSCKIQGVEYSTGDYYFDENSPPHTATSDGSQPTANSGDSAAQTDNGGFAIDASAIEAASDPYEYIAAELDKAYGDVFGAAEVSDFPVGSYEGTSIRIRFDGYEIGSVEDAAAYMPEMEKAIIEMTAPLKEAKYIAWAVRVYILEGGSQIGDITFGYDFAYDSAHAGLYMGDTFYQYVNGVWVVNRHNDILVKDEW